ncbi:DUF3048 domain-containing protein [Paenibacillus soyae]|uniref:DUF3048 domain-containing protein n=1 Tax=Paenibacillus soyae TaxID=2969249 RepID=A0A9X2MQR2_9BACL|nr:DUF3048 domain-containing protein [Paenibacillus soyae]MCR2804527.1 DUF3048 domain-containing protein [Paenibacillus soyae]
MSFGWRSQAAAWLAASFLLLSACSGDKAVTVPPSEINETATPEASPTPSPEPTPPPYTAPLTGIGRENEAANRPIAVMVNNFSAARPQSGLTNADVVWEVLAEGGITRLVAVFQSTDALADTIGPIRSNRAYLIDIADSYGAVMVHAGGSPEAYSILKKQGKPYLDEITNAGSYYWRSKERKAPHNLYSNLEKMREGADKKGYDKDKQSPTYPFSEAGAAGAAAEKATDIAITFLMQDYEVTYTYDEAAGLYKRSINGEPHIDLNNNQQLAAANVIVFEAGHKTLDNVGRLAVDLESGGSGYLFQGGKKEDIEWLRSEDGMVRFTKDGQEVSFLPGKTYIHVVPNRPALAEHVSWNESQPAS